MFKSSLFHDILTYNELYNIDDNIESSQIKQAFHKTPVKSSRPSIIFRKHLHQAFCKL